MKKVILFNIVFALFVLFFQQMNTSLYNFIHFDPTQSLFSRDDYVVIAIIFLVLLIVITMILRNIYINIVEENNKTIVFYEFFVFLIISIIYCLIMTYLVFNPIHPSTTIFDYNRPYIVFVMIYMIEVGILGYLLVRCIKYLRSK